MTERMRIPHYRDAGPFAASRRPVAAEQAPPPGLLARMRRRLGGGVLSLFKGLGLTFGKFIDPRHVVTCEYPENRAELRFPARFRGTVSMPHDADGEHRCTACTICEKACPNATISILPTTDIAGQKVLGRFVYRWDQCTLCALCVEACPYGAIVMDHEFEGATAAKLDLVRILNRKEGR